MTEGSVESVLIRDRYVAWKNVAKVSCMNLLVHRRGLCPDISLFEDIVISFLLHVLGTSLCLPVIWSLSTVAAKCPSN